MVMVVDGPDDAGPGRVPRCDRRRDRDDRALRRVERQRTTRVRRTATDLAPRIRPTHYPIDARRERRPNVVPERAEPGDLLASLDPKGRTALPNRDLLRSCVRSSAALLSRSTDNVARRVALDCTGRAERPPPAGRADVPRWRGGRGCRRRCTTCRDA